MKDYGHIVVWLDYFNKVLPRSRGRRVGKEGCVFDPSLKELLEAVKEAGLKTVESEDTVRYPRRPYVRSGYVVLPKESAPKTAILRRISEKLLAKRFKPSKEGKS